MHSVRLNSRIGPPKRFRQFKRGHRSGTLAGRAILIASLFCLTDGISALAIETSTALAPTSANSEFSLEPDYKKYQKERRAIEAMLSDIEIQWNAHNLESVLKHYADDYINNDGLDKKAVRELTKDFWKTYPDAKSSSKTKQIRIEGKFATVESRDRAVGSTAKAMPSVQSKGELISISEGQLYLKRTGNDWKIIGD
ncbi:MAG: nuclear transport factor 2 family protein, partial [Candidatus Obscuribacterales bacterium]|nr:nuclear transport factor 2 family protein [Candidatus Obscuribacterales bacterium]